MNMFALHSLIYEGTRDFIDLLIDSRHSLKSVFFYRYYLKCRFFYCYVKLQTISLFSVFFLLLYSCVCFFYLSRHLTFGLLLLYVQEVLTHFL